MTADPTQRLGWEDVDPSKVYKFDNCQVLRGQELKLDSVYVRGGKIVDPQKLWWTEKKSHDFRIDLAGQILSPGFIELQINGGWGVDFSSDLTVSTAEPLKKVALNLLSHGVTSFCPTIVSSSAATYARILKNITKFEGSAKGAACLGAHLEGPFINPIKKGAHNSDYIVQLEGGMESITNMYGNMLDNVAIVTLAPEMKSALDVIGILCQRGIVVSIGHSNANYEVVTEAVAKGARMVTHLYNSMGSFHHRDPGIIGALGILRGKLSFGIVGDGHHTHDAALRIVHRCQPQGVVLTTDATAALGLSDGIHHLGSKEIVVTGTRAVLANTNTLSGSVTPMLWCIRNYIKATGCTLGEALSSATENPARVMGIGKTKGKIVPGADADFVVLDHSMSVVSTWIRGRMVYHA